MSALARKLELLAFELQQHPSRTAKPLSLNDPFILTSCLQKALRRGERGIAIAAAGSLLAIDPGRLWRRLAIIAFEDFGLVDLDLTASIVAAASNKKWRAMAGGDGHVMSYLVEQLANRPRDRRVDALYMLAVRHVLHPPSQSDFFAQQPSEAATDLILKAGRIIAVCEQAVPYRAFRAVRANQCDQALQSMADAGIMDDDLRTICIQGRRTSMCLLPVLLPLGKQATDSVGEAPVMVSREPPEIRQIGEVPGYALCGFTRLGQVALAKLVRSDRNLGQMLSGLTGRARSDALTYLLFEAEGGVCTREVSDPLYEELKMLALGCWTGLPGQVVSRAIGVMRDAVPALNDVRAALMKQY